MGRNNAGILHTLRTDSRAKQFGYTLDIGVHLNIPADKSASVGKVTSHDIAFPFRLYETMINLQVTLVGHTGEWKDDISCYIRNWRINTVYKNLKDTPEVIQSTLTIELYTFRINGEHHWGIHLHAYLLVNIFNDNLLVIKNSI